MFQKLLSVFGLILLVSASAFAQSGTLKGKLVDKDTKEPVPFANIVIESGGKQFGGTTTDFDGNYTIKPIPPGSYDVKATYVGYKPLMITGVLISTDKITFLDVDMESTAVTLTTFEVVDYKVPLIEKDGGSSGGTMTSEEIDKMPGRDATSVAITVGGVFSSDGEMGSIRGGRTDGTVMYIDGVRVRGSSSLPKAALEQVTVITGGLPAIYGDATGGVVNITTKGASRNFNAGAELVTSQYLDPYGYNLLGLNIMGPLIRGRDTTKNTSLLGFFLAGELSYEKDTRPFHGGLYKATDEYLQYVEENPLRPTGLGFGTFQNLQFIDESQLENIKAKIESPSKSVSLSAKIDVRTTATTTLTFGGSLNYSDDISYVHGYSMFNYKNYPQVINNTWRVFGRFTQRFEADTSNKSLIKNVYYTFQADYSKFNQVVQDPNHKDNLFDYGYWGEFNTYKVKSYAYGDLPDHNLYDVYYLNNFYDTLVTFNPSTLNPTTANYTSQYYSLYPLNSGFYSNYTTIQNFGALLNGEQPGDIYGLWSAPGTIYNQYSKYDGTQIGVNAMASADVGNHAIQFGIQYEQRNDAYIGYSPVGLWTKMRQLANKHIEQLDSVPILIYDDYGVFQDTVEFDRLYDGASQAYFDEQIREKLGYNITGTDWIDIDSYDPTMYSIDMFTADELLNEGYSYVAYYGYDHKGNRLTTRPSFDDFFTDVDENGNYTRLIPSFEPIYMAGYIQDKFAFKDLIFNIGLRVDRFDANQSVLKDEFLFFEAKTVGEVANLGEHPSNMGSDYVVYVDNAKAPTQILGYRDGNVWYNAQGGEITDPSLISTSSGIAPYLEDPSLLKPTSAAFKDYEPQITYMPRISFSFPISDEALFFAHYDVTSKRPTDGLRMNPSSYYFIQTQSTDFISNPALKPEKTVDYELGFQQLLSVRSALKFSAYYREMRDLVQTYRFVGAYPIDYYSYNNIDFGTVKGMTISYDLRRNANIWMKASYTLQFADGTGSSSTSGVNLVRTGQPNLRTLNPLDFDRRHAFTLVFDYRYGQGTKYNGPTINRKQDDGKVKTIPLLQNVGMNFTFTGGSGTPYSRSSNIVSAVLGGNSYQLQGMMNGSRLPWSFRIDAKLDKDIQVKLGKKDAYFNVYLEVLNVLNSKNILAVYRSTGNPDDDGYLAASEYQAGINAQVNPETFRMLYSYRIDSPYNYSLPRRIRLGVQFSF
ncbi:MAG: carboxypeptidase regulatory-like domain-containing protein [Bacteroidales bacterium]|nr:carboxypeptidase regulatory-like domain-containing protein [Bacteroidales bacterium]